MPADLSALRVALQDRYRLEREVGAGGMATVYQAHDLKHDREVALKVLRSDLVGALGAERFLAEIRTTANLHHPHILPLYDSGDADGHLFYVMPFVEGESLRDRLTREKQLPLEDALQITYEVADALGYAHSHHVIHRDIKPENILLESGHAVVADFGIAKAVAVAGGQKLTEPGLAVGTPSYMSPEQGAGEQDLDGRSDLYSLASVLYEMLVGEPPVSGPNAQATIAKLMTERPTALHVLRDTVPPGVEAAVMKALSKVPADRFASAAAFGEALQTGTTVVMAAHAPARRLPWMLAAAVLVVAAAAVALSLRRGTSARRAPTDYAPDRQATFSGDVGRLALAPDGRTAAFVTQDKGTIVLQDLDGGGSQPVYSAPTGSFIEATAWSPDGGRILFGLVSTSLQVMSIPRLGGEPRREMDLSHLLRLNGLNMFPAGPGEWIVSSDRRMYVGPDPASLRQEGGYLAGTGVFSTPGEGGLGFFAVTSPDGDWVAFSGNDSTWALGTSIVSRNGSVGPGRITEWAGLAVCGWTADGSGVYLLRDEGGKLDLLRAPIDQRTGRPKGHPALVYPRLQGASEVHISGDGKRLVVVSGPTSTRVRIFELDRTPDPADNPETVLSQGTAEWRYPSFLPDGRIAVASIVPDGYDILALSRTGSPPQLLAQRRGAGVPFQPPMNPSPDGQTFAPVERDHESGAPSAVTLLDVGAGRARVIPLPERPSGVAWSADGKHLGAMTAQSPNRVMTVDVGAGTARSVELKCGDRCEFAFESISIGPDWPLAAVSSQYDVWIADLETGVVRLLAADAWEVVKWLGDWVYFTRGAGQTDQRRVTLFRVRASGGAEERLFDLPPDCGDHVTVSDDRTLVACAEVTTRPDIRVIDNFDPAAGSR
jgi:dipeptidyl aminopeptidase/acylaminoacyl peptidase